MRARGVRGRVGPVLGGRRRPGPEKGKGKGKGDDHTKKADKGKGKDDAKGKGRGKEIAEKAKGAKLDKGRQATAMKGGKRVTFTPAELGKLKSEKDLEAGQVVGHLDTELPGDESGLPPGKYNLLLAKEGDKWVVHAESGGQVVGPAKDVKVGSRAWARGEGEAAGQAEVRREGVVLGGDVRRLLLGGDRRGRVLRVHRGHLLVTPAAV